MRFWTLAPLLVSSAFARPSGIVSAVLLPCCKNLAFCLSAQTPRGSSDRCRSKPSILFLSVHSIVRRDAVDTLTGSACANAARSSVVGGESRIVVVPACSTTDRQAEERHRNGLLYVRTLAWDTRSMSEKLTRKDAPEGVQLDRIDDPRVGA